MEQLTHYSYRQHYVCEKNMNNRPLRREKTQKQIPFDKKNFHMSTQADDDENDDNDILLVI